MCFCFVSSNTILGSGFLSFSISNHAENVSGCLINARVIHRCRIRSLDFEQGKIDQYAKTNFPKQPCCSNVLET